MNTLNKNFEAEIYDLLAKLSVLYDKTPSQNRLIAYVAVLKSKPIDRVRQAILEASTACFTFPSLAWLCQRIDAQTDEKELAVQIAGEIISSLLKFSAYDSDKARAHLGEFAWLAVERIGGWHSLCAVTTSELGTLRAQLRELIASHIKTARMDPKLIQSKAQQRTLLSCKSEMKQLCNLLTLNQEEEIK